MPKISITSAATFLSGLMIAIVATVTLSVSYFVVFDSIRDVGHTAARSFAQNSFVAIDQFLSRPLVAAKAAQDELRSTNWSLPINDPDPNWFHKWIKLTHTLKIHHDYGFSSIAFMLADNNIIRGYTVGNVSAAVVTDVKDPSPNSTKKYRVIIDQFDFKTFEKPTDESPFKDLAHPSAFWDTSPHIEHTKALSNNFSVGVMPYYLTTQALIVTPSGVSVVSGVHATLHNIDGVLLGALALTDKVSTINELLASVAVTSNTEIFVIRHTGSIIATTHESKSPNRTLLPPTFNFSTPKHPDCDYPDYKTLSSDRWFMTCQVQALDHPYAPLNSFVASADYEREQQPGRTEEFFYSLVHSKKTYYVAGRPLVYKNANFTLALFMPEEDVLSEVVAVRNLSLVICIVLAIVCCVVTAAVMHFMLMPLSTMCTKLSNVAKLKLDDEAKHKEKKSTVKEIFDLQTAYSDMIVQLKLVRRFVPQAMFGGDHNQLADNSGTTIAEYPEDKGAGMFDDLTQYMSGNSTTLLLNPLTATGGGSKQQEYVQERLLKDEAANQFRLRDCSILCLTITKPASNSSKVKEKGAIELLAKEVLWRAIHIAQENHGVVEQLRPDSFIVSFNAHSRCVMHRHLAIKAALTMAWSFSHEMPTCDISFGIAVDAGEHFVGTCGSDDQRAAVVIGNAFDNTPALAMMARDEYVAQVIATEVVTKGLSSAVSTFPLDVLELNGSPKSIFEVVPNISPLDLPPDDRFIEAFGCIRQGDGAKAIAHLQTIQQLDCNAASSDARKHCQFRAQMLMVLSESISRPHLRPFIPHNWILTPKETLVAGQQQRTNSQGASGGCGGGDSESTLSSLHSVDALRTVSHDDVGRRLREALQSNSSNPPASPNTPSHDQVNKPSSSSPLEFPETVVDTNRIQWIVSKKKLGQGAFGAVLLGLGEDGSLAALKFVPLFKGEKSATELQHEVLMLCDLSHENITHYVSCAVSDNYFVLITEYISGGSLADTIKSFPRLPPKLLKRYAVEMLSGLAYLHDAGMMHCDIKPDNVLMTAEGSCKLADFGSALALRKHVGENIEVTIHGTAWYMAPEVARGGNVSFAADMWSFGVTMLALALGKIPFAPLKGCRSTAANFMEALARNDYQFCFQREDLSREMQIIFDTCLVQSSKERTSAVKLLALIS